MDFPFASSKLTFSIRTSWNKEKLNHDPVHIHLERDQFDPNFLVINIKAPFFASPRKPDEAIDAAFNLWDYEGNF